MISVTLDKVPHFVVKDQETRDDEKKELLREYSAFFQMLLGAYSTLGLRLHAEQSENVRRVSFDYFFPNAFFPIQSLARELQFLKVTQTESISAPFSFNISKEEARFQRKLRLTPVGDLAFVQGDIAMLSPGVEIKERRTFKIPVTRRIELLTTDYKWRHTLETLTKLDGTLNLRIRKFQPNPKEVAYAQQCLSWYLHTYKGNLPGDEIRANTHVYQAIIADEDMFEVTVSAGQTNSQALQLAFVRDSDIEAFRLNEVSIDEKALTTLDENTKNFLLSKTR